MVMLRELLSKLKSRENEELSARTARWLQFNQQRFRTRQLRPADARVAPAIPRVHFGCGDNRVPGWLNVDLVGSDFDVDLAAAVLPWPDGTFEAAIGQHVIEHLELTTELIPLLRELSRVLQPGGELWVSCPDIEKACRSYLDHRMVDLVEDRRKRLPHFSLDGIPSQHLINDLFNQHGEHRNLFDFELLEWTLQKSGFGEITRMAEADLLARFPGFPARNDDRQAIYVRATPDRQSVPRTW